MDINLEIAESIVETVREPLVLLDEGLRVCLANHSFYRTFKVLPEATEGELIYELGNGQWNIPQLRHLLEGILPQNAEFANFEVEHDFPEIGRRTMVLNGRRLRRDSGAAGLILLALSDITERKRAEKALQRLNQDLGRSNAELEQFAYVASHDLQEPLRTVAGFSDLLKRRYRGKLDSEADEFIDTIVAATVRMQALINDLLAYSRVGRHGKPFAPVDCNQVLADVLAGLESAIEKAEGEIKAEPLPVVHGDRAQLAQLLQNLIANALKFRGQQKPQIRLRTQLQDSHWIFAVSDNGIGIEPQYSERIFRMFQRLHTRAEYPGSGIGLAICRKIVERHGGKIWVESRVGEGATFFFTLQKGSVDANQAY